MINERISFSLTHDMNRPYKRMEYIALGNGYYERRYRDRVTYAQRYSTVTK
jgi:hypothetical protein